MRESSKRYNQKAKWEKDRTQRLGWAAKQPLGNAALGALFA